MIYSVNPDIFPKEGQYIELISYKDENGLEWQIARIENGFFVKYFGDDYFRDSTFECELSNGSWVRINNTGCILFQNTEFEAFCEVRDILKNGNTDDIWECFTELFTERFERDKGVIESEIITS